MHDGGMQILLTNDDGIDSPGLHALANKMCEFGDVTVFAPSGEYSGASVAIGHLAEGIADVYRCERPEMPGAQAVYHLDGPPALTVLLAGKGMFGSPPDLVVSGVNPGANVGLGVHYSGTVGACIAAAGLGIPGIAVSLQGVKRDGFAHWETATDACARHVLRAASERRLVNINVPNRPLREVEGERSAPLSRRLPWSLHNPSMEPTSEPDRFSVSFERYGPFEHVRGADVVLLDEGYVTITDLTPTHPA